MKMNRTFKTTISFILCIFMLLSLLPFSVNNANAAVTAYLKQTETEVYEGDVINLIAGVSGASEGETFTYQWQAEGTKWLNLDDNDIYRGTKTEHLQMETLGRSALVNIPFRCKIVSSKGKTYYTGNYSFPALIEKTPINIIAFTGMDTPEYGALPPKTATPGNSKYYKFDYIEWYQSGEDKMADGEKFKNGSCYCKLYFTMEKGYKLAEDIVCGLYNDDYDTQVLQDETTGQYYVQAFYHVKNDESIINSYTPSQEVKSGDTATFSVDASNAKSYQWQVRKVIYSNNKVRYVWSNLSDKSERFFTYTGTNTDTLSVKTTGNFKTTYYRCKVTSTTDEVIYSHFVTISQINYVKITGKVKTFGSSEEYTNLSIKQYDGNELVTKFFQQIKNDQYSFSNVKTGNYILEISKAGQLTRRYELKVGLNDVTLDVAIAEKNDVNMDGVVNIEDAALIQKNVILLAELDEYQKELADANNDGKVTVVDSTKLQKILV